MFKIASLVLASGLGLAAAVHSAPAEAHPYVRVAVGLPVIAPVALAAPYYGPYYYSYGRYWRPGVRFGHDGFYRRWYRR
jgi:hypothetical protein